MNAYTDFSLSTGKVSRMLGVHRNTVIAMLSKGIVAGIRLGVPPHGKWRISEKSVFEYMEHQWKTTGNRDEARRD